MSRWGEYDTRSGVPQTNASWMSSGATSCATPGAAGNAVWPSANLVIYAPLELLAPFPLWKFLSFQGTGAVGTVTMGLYTADGTRLAQTAATAHVASTLFAVVPTDTTLVIAPGEYHIAMVYSDAATDLCSRATGLAVSALRSMGWFQEAGAGGLPAVATFATVTNAYCPFMGMSRNTGGV